MIGPSARAATAVPHYERREGGQQNLRASEACLRPHPSGKNGKGYRIPQATITSQDGECIVAQLKLKAGQSEEEQKCD
jgi:hypothetical protein